MTNWGKPEKCSVCHDRVGVHECKDGFICDICAAKLSEELREKGPELTVEEIEKELYPNNADAPCPQTQAFQEESSPPVKKNNKPLIAILVLFCTIAIGGTILGIAWGMNEEKTSSSKDYQGIYNSEGDDSSYSHDNEGNLHDDYENDTYDTHGDYYGTVEVTYEQYSQIESEMTYDEVVDIFGGKGKLLSESGDDTLGYWHIIGWDGSGTLGANLNITFHNGKVYGKAQAGLK